HAPIRSGVQLYIIDVTAGVDLGTGAALSARLRSDAGLAVQRLGENARQGRLAHTAGAGEQPGMVQTLGVQGVGERTNHMVLTDEGIERTRPPLACQY